MPCFNATSNKNQYTPLRDIANNERSQLCATILWNFVIGYLGHAKARTYPLINESKFPRQY